MMRHPGRVGLLVAIMLAGALACAGAASAAPYLYGVNDSDYDWTISQYDATDGGLTQLAPDVVIGTMSTEWAQTVALNPAVSPSGQALYVPLPVDDTVLQYDIGSDGTLKAMATAGVSAGTDPVAVAVSPDGRYAYAANFGSTDVSEYDVESDGALRPMADATVPAGGAPASIAISPDGAHVYVANYNDGTISEYDVGSDGALTPMAGAPVAAGGSNSPLDGLALSPDGSSLYAVGGELWQYDVAANGELLPKLPASINDVDDAQGLAVAPDGRDVYNGDEFAELGHASVGPDGLLTAQDTAPSPTGGIDQLVVSPDGRSVYAPLAGTHGGYGVGQWNRGAGGALSEMTPARLGTTTEPTIGIAVTPASDVALTAASAPSRPAAGQLLTYTLTASNAGSPASGVTVTDPLPSDVTLQSASASQGSCTTTGNVTCSLGSLADGASATVTITVRTLSPGTVSNAASIEAIQPDPDSTNNDATTSATVTQAPLATATPASALTATGATLNGVVDPDGSATTYQFQWGTAGSYTNQAPAVPGDAGAGTTPVAVTTALAGLAPSTTYSYRLVAVSAGGATSTSDTQTFTTPAQPPTNVALSVGASIASGHHSVGAPLQFRFTITNTSAVAATGVQLIDPVPAHATYRSTGSSSGCRSTGHGTVVTCAVGTLAPGAKTVVRVVLIPRLTGSLVNTAIANANQPNATAANSIATARTTTRPASSPLRVVEIGAPKQKGRAVLVTLACRGSASQRCRGTITLTTATPTRGSKNKPAARGRQVTLGRASYALRSGQRSTVRIRLSPTGQKLLAGKHRLVATLAVGLRGTGTRPAARHLKLKATT